MNDDPLMTTTVVDSQEVTPKDILRFAKSILSTMAMLAVFGSMTEMLFPHNDVFGSLREILPSMATMVIGFYFGKVK